MGNRIHKTGNSGKDVMLIRIIFALILILLILPSFLVFKNLGSKNQDTESLRKKAQNVFNEAKNKGVNFSDGPCLSNNLAPDWVLDISHNPRLPIDNLPQNQCAAFLSGQAHHFIELDTNGKFMRGI